MSEKATLGSGLKNFALGEIRMLFLLKTVWYVTHDMCAFSG